MVIHLLILIGRSAHQVVEMPIEFFLTGDLKFLTDWCGVHGKDEFCLLCGIKAKDRDKCFELVRTEIGDTLRKFSSGKSYHDVCMLLTICSTKFSIFDDY